MLASSIGDLVLWWWEVDEGSVSQDVCFKWLH